MKTYISISVLLLLATFAANAIYYSQPGAKQDQWLNENIFHNKRSLVFVDLGAYDGKTYSNSLFFEETLGWTGICVEPHPKLFEKLTQLRRCICVHGCVSNIEGQVDFLEINDGPEVHVDGPKMLGGIYQKYDQRHINRVFNEVAQDGGTQQLTKVNAYLLNELLSKHNIYHIDYLSIDTEGSEMDIIESIDYTKFYIYIISVENNFGTPQFSDFLISKGFELIKVLDHDEIYRNTKYMSRKQIDKQTIEQSDKTEL